ncbi:hypothetical protein [uncultured Rheinheimera sp.]|uniref:hypothetical protein n=1 Tax=uncultured Rheinheimera sp. TaxID=400532 RepID=UPI0025916A10|nr:hypothetical protein [uncultured Rheinheimera sp.]
MDSMVAIDWSKMVTAEEKAKKEKANKTQLVKSESTRRIALLWDSAGQANVALGIYSDGEQQACIDWINAHREACQAIIDRPDLLELDITDDSLWPVVPEPTIS